MSVRFSASSQHYESTVGLPASSTYSVTLWGYMTNDRNDYSCIWAIENAATSGTSYVTLQAEADGTQFSVFSSLNGGQFITNMVPGGWFRLGLSVNAGAGTVYYGAPTGALSTTAFTIGAPAGLNRMFLGSDSYGEWWDGRIAAVKMWQAALNATEIAAEFDSYDAVRTSNLLRTHKLQAPSTADDSGLGNTLTGGSGASTEADPPIVVASALPRPPVVGPSAAVMRSVW